MVHGNCLTGIFPLALLNEDCVSTAVLCQPATPLMSKKEVLFHSQPERHKRALGLTNKDVSAGIAALKNDPSKKLLGFHYRADPLGAYEKFEVIHERLAKEGMADRFRPFIKYPKRGTVEDWWAKLSEPTTEKRGLKGPHSTVTGAKSNEDRQWFRDQLATALR